MRFNLHSCFLILILGAIIVGACTPQAAQTENIPADIEADEQPEPSPESIIPAPSDELNKTPETESAPIIPVVQLPEPLPPPPAPVETKLPEPKPAIAYPDPFDGASINADKYSLLIKGNGSTTQDNEIISIGNAKDEVVWSILYPTQNIDFTKDFTVTVDVNLTADVQRGDAMAILAIENLEDISAAKMPERNYCEISTGSSHGTMIRTFNSGHGSQLTKTAGKFSISFNALKEQFTCSLNDKELSYDKKIDFGKYFLTLRSGIHQISGGGTESGSTGSFTVKYDNLDIITKKD